MPLDLRKAELRKGNSKEPTPGPGSRGDGQVGLAGAGLTSPKCPVQASRKQELVWML